MRKGFIYSVRKPPFSYPKSDKTTEFERLVKEALGLKVILSDRESLIFEIGYEFGLIDGGV